MGNEVNVEHSSAYIREWIWRLGAEAGEDERFLAELVQGMLDEPEVTEEFVYYVKKGDFLCKGKVEGYTVIDIMIWQMDHFKAELDRDRYDMKNNRGKMVLRAFDTMLKMKKNPGKYKALMQSETGTDYPGKY